MSSLLIPNIYTNCGTTFMHNISVDDNGPSSIKAVSGARLFV